ncbi:ParA family protein [Gallibacterium anatis]|uniref:ParA family protein n=1 Tax=Gallibacterium anatis TaxID=750 RepID=UPI003005BE28
MKIITVYNLKGGCGKTTISILTAQILNKKGYRVALLDSNQEQKSTANWAEHSQMDIPCFMIENQLTKEDIEGLKQEYDFAIIDGTPTATEYSQKIIELSDIVIVPVQPSQLAVSAFCQPTNLGNIHFALGKGKSVKFILNGCNQYNREDTNDLYQMLIKLFPNTPLFRLNEWKAYKISYDKPFIDSKDSKAQNQFGYIIDKLLEELN